MLETLESALEAEDIDAELLNGILSISTEGGQVVLNKHLPTRQLWFASPVSGAARFSHTGGQWAHTVTGESLENCLKRELGR